MTLQQLLQQLESLSYHDRVRRMVELGRQVSTDTQVRDILNSLEQGDFTERLLALNSCYGSYDGAKIIRALSDNSHLIRSKAVQMVGPLTSDAQVQTALNTVTLKDCRYVLKQLLKWHRRSCIDTFINQLASTNNDSFSRLLPCASSELVQRHIESVIDFYGIDEWKLLARLHPRIVEELLQRRANATSEFDPRLTTRVNAVLPLLSELFPETALSICRTVSGIIPLSNLNLQPLTERYPRQVADLILSSNDRANVSFDKVAHKLETQQLISLINRRKYTINEQYIFYLLAPQQREIIYRTFADSWRSSIGGNIIPAIIPYLPRHIREQEAQRYLNLPRNIFPEERLYCAAYLPWGDTHALVNPYINDPDPELRKQALSTLIFATRYNRSHTSDILNIVKQRRNEQDPVRGAMIKGLAELPSSIWHSQHLEDLSQIISHAFNAVDLSNFTVISIERLVIQILPFHPAWSAGQLATLVQQRGQINFYDLGERLSNSDMPRVAPILLPVLQSWERKRESNIIAAARSFGHRLKVFDGLVEILERIIKNTRNNTIASEALDLIAKYRRDKLNELIPQLLQQDPSWITQYTVYNFLHRKRQDLITPFLRYSAYTGLFSTDETRFILPLTNGFNRWTTQQQEIFQRTLEEVIQDPERDTLTKLCVIKQLAALPGVQPTSLQELANPDNPQLVIRDAALLALPQLDSPYGIPILVEALNDDRARIAIYALRSMLLQMPENQALQTLRAVPLNKVTVAKEVVRLLGELPSSEAYTELLSWNERDLHRDVRVAFIRALSNHLEHPETWPILFGAATSSDTAIARTVGRQHYDQSQNNQQQLLELFVTLLNHPDPVVRLDILERCCYFPVSDPSRILLPVLQQCINSRIFHETSQAINALLTTYKNSADIIGATVRSVISNRRILLELTQYLLQILRYEQQQMLPTARAAIEAMQEDPLTTSLQVDIAIYAFSWEELARFFQQLALEGKMHHEVLFRAVQGLEQIIIRNDTSELIRLEEILAPSDDEKLRRIALAALIAQSQVRGWNNVLKQRLYAFRNDPSPMVAEKAQFIILPDS
ncbi:hypothetical protein DSM106972_046280 [Dulcicalothrix desertica PCC 7102]|uniref:HEAT repeat domain-containing protein n=1 Tax=Dulcicalothrix desertica PCC 7102 TaxID=232991 RepID=A0A433VE69_9CYAN|nr:hypothetical protein [Dulcicalothrix desertica]RUT04400.1 hypothetical protein DSM106972_046280 [Dulcicalothrix desertica PCC 7102]TWH51254.1 hypothetical protein CAL7102_05648 [Dulcicalothrix desertica PCC 7102]